MSINFMNRCMEIWKQSKYAYLKMHCQLYLWYSHMQWCAPTLQTDHVIRQNTVAQNWNYVHVDDLQTPLCAQMRCLSLLHWKLWDFKPCGNTPRLGVHNTSIVSEGNLSDCMRSGINNAFQTSQLGTPSMGFTQYTRHSGWPWSYVWRASAWAMMLEPTIARNLRWSTCSFSKTQ